MNVYLGMQSMDPSALICRSAVFLVQTKQRMSFANGLKPTKIATKIRNSDQQYCHEGYLRHDLINIILTDQLKISVVPKRISFVA